MTTRKAPAKKYHRDSVFAHRDSLAKMIDNNRSLAFALECTAKPLVESLKQLEDISGGDYIWEVKNAKKKINQSLKEINEKINKLDSEVLGLDTALHYAEEFISNR